MRDEIRQLFFHPSSLIPHPSSLLKVAMQVPTFTPSADVSCIDLTVKRKVEGTRLDQYLVLMFSDLSRSAIQRIIEAGAVLVNGHPGKASYKIRYDDQIRI